MKLKTTAASNGTATLAHPYAPVGPSTSGDVITYEVRNIPEGTPAARVVLLFNQSCQVSGHTFDFADLVPGRILRGI